MRIQQVILHRLHMPLQFRFETSFGVQTFRDVLLVEVEDQAGAVGWGECVALAAPLYNEETTDTAEIVLKNELIPRILGWEWQHPQELQDRIAAIHRHYMAKFALEGALWDAYARHHHTALATLLGGVKTKLPTGVSLGIQPLDALLEEIGQYLDQGYQRIKIKIKPGWDRTPLEAIRSRYPTVPLTVDANTAYTMDDADLLQSLDDFNLLMIEQPFGENAWDDHARLQAQIKTPICLDESIHTVLDARRAISQKACRIINVKLGRIGGLQAGIELNALARDHHIDLWCGGMLETGIGRAHNIAITTLDAFRMPGDTAASRRYWNPDIITPEVDVTDGFITVPKGPGIGFDIDVSKLRRYQLRQQHFRH